jgi:hypothetical protein
MVTGKALGGSRASQSMRMGSVVSYSAVACDYTTATPQSPCPRLVTWLRCRQCQRGYFTTGAPGPQPCPACVSGRLQPVALSDLVHDAVPAGMLRREEM